MSKIKKTSKKKGIELNKVMVKKEKKAKKT